MKALGFLATIALATNLISSHASAYDPAEGRVQFYCTVGNPFISGMSAKFSVSFRSDDVIEGYFDGKAFSFVDKTPKHEPDGVLVYSGRGITVKYQRPGPYDGLQDTQWGLMTDGTTEKNVNCYPNE